MVSLTDFGHSWARIVSFQNGTPGGPASRVAYGRIRAITSLTPLGPWDTTLAWVGDVEPEGIILAYVDHSLRWETLIPLDRQLILGRYDMGESMLLWLAHPGEVILPRILPRGSGDLRETIASFLYKNPPTHLSDREFVAVANRRLQRNPQRFPAELRAAFSLALLEL